MMKVIVIQEDKQIDISAFSGNVTLADNIDSLGRELNFDFVNNHVYDSYTQFTALRTGNTILLYDNDIFNIEPISKDGESFFGIPSYYLTVKVKCRFSSVVIGAQNFYECLVISAI